MSIDYNGYVKGDMKRAMNYFNRSLSEQAVSNLCAMNEADIVKTVERFNSISGDLKLMGTLTYKGTTK